MDAFARPPENPNRSRQSPRPANLAHTAEATKWRGPILRPVMGLTSMPVRFTDKAMCDIKADCRRGPYLFLGLYLTPALRRRLICAGGVEGDQLWGGLVEQLCHRLVKEFIAVVVPTAAFVSPAS
jgi:hypothetical protein